MTKKTATVVLVSLCTFAIGILVLAGVQSAGYYNVHDKIEALSR